ncbi:hypothetical protein V1511DRAFT_456407 [Dipodascopsis uninucleata]
MHENRGEHQENEFFDSLADAPPLPIPEPTISSGNALLNDKESLAYSDFLDRLALDSEFIFDPILPDTLPNLQNDYSSSQAGVQSSTASQHYTTNGEQFLQLPLFSPSAETPTLLTPNSIKSENITVEDRAVLLREAHRKQGLAWGSDPRFSSNGFKSDYLKTDHIDNDGQQITASEILRKMSQDGSPWISSHSPSSIQSPSTFEYNKPAVTNKYRDRQRKRSSSSLSSNDGPTSPNPMSTGSQSVKYNIPEDDDKLTTLIQSKRARRGSTSVERETLTDAQRRRNHITSEKKRRDIIKQGFEELSHLVPILRAGGFSKSTVLQHVADYLRELNEKKMALSELIEQLEKESGVFH